MGSDPTEEEYLAVTAGTMKNHNMRDIALSQIQQLRALKAMNAANERAQIAQISAFIQANKD